jgi:hypothetical protein
MNIDKKTIIVFGIGLVGGYLLCTLMNRNKTSISVGADGKPSPNVSAVRKRYKWNGQGKVLTHSKRSAEWRDSYLEGGEIFRLTGNTDYYNGVQYSETTIQRMGTDNLPVYVWLQTSSLILLG